VVKPVLSEGRRTGAPKKPSYITREQVYDIIRKNTRSSEGAYSDIGEANRQMLAVQRNQQFESQGIEQRARMRKAQRKG